MKKKVFLILLAVLLAISVGIIGCTAPAQQEEEEEEEERIPLLVATGPVYWGGYPIAVGMSDIVSKDSNLDITVRSETGSLAIATALAEGLVDFASGIGGTSNGKAYYGIAEFEEGGPYENIRGVCFYNIMKRAILAEAYRDVKTIPDLVGKEVLFSTTISNLELVELLENYGIDVENDIIQVHGSGRDAINEKIMGREIYILHGLPGSDILELYEAQGDLVPLPVDEDIFEHLADEHVEAMIGHIFDYIEPGEEPYFDWMTEAVGCIAIPTMVSTRSDVPESWVYTYLKTLLTHMEDVQQAAPGLEDFGPDVLSLPSVVPYHDGAIMALKEFGLWTDEMQTCHDKALQGIPFVKCD